MLITLAWQCQRTGVLDWGSYGYSTSMGSPYVSNIEDLETQVHPFIQWWQSTGELICNHQIYKSLFFMPVYWLLSFSRVTSPSWAFLDRSVIFVCSLIHSVNVYVLLSTWHQGHRQWWRPGPALRGSYVLVWLSWMVQTWHRGHYP